MPYYAVPGSQVVITTAYKTGAQVNATGTNKRGKVFQIILGAVSNPSATDTYLDIDLSRITGTGAGAYTAFTPNPFDAADGAAVNAAGINSTAEATAITANSTMFHEGMNQRNSLNLLLPQESQYISWAATAGTGLVLRGQSATFGTSFAMQLNFME